MKVPIGKIKANPAPSKNSEKTEAKGKKPAAKKAVPPVTGRRKGLANLKPFKKGQSGNPKGRPKKLPQLDELMAEVLGEEKDGITAAKAILAKLRQKAISGDVRAAEIMLDRAYGKAKQSMEITEKTIVVRTPDDEE